MRLEARDGIGDSDAFGEDEAIEGADGSLCGDELMPAVAAALHGDGFGLVFEGEGEGCGLGRPDAEADAAVRLEFGTEGHGVARAGLRRRGGCGLRAS